MWWLLGLAIAAPSVRPFYALSKSCHDARYPALAGEWAVGCGSDGLVDRAVSLESGRELRLPFASESPGLGPNAVYAPGPHGGLVRFVDGEVITVADVTNVVNAPVAPAATDGEHIAVAAGDQLQAFPATEKQRRSIAAHPAGWYPPALAWPWVAWVEDAGADGEDVVGANMARNDGVVPLATGPGYQRHVVGDGRWLAWVEEGAVVIWDSMTDERQLFEVDTGFHAPITLSSGVACWETRDGPDIDLACSDGFVLRRPGDQTWPSRSGRWLLFREDGSNFLLTVDAP